MVSLSSGTGVNPWNKGEGLHDSKRSLVLCSEIVCKTDGGEWNSDYAHDVDLCSGNRKYRW